MPLLMICEILGVFVNILTAAGKYPLQACQNLLLQIQMQLSKKRKSFSNSLFHFWNFHHFKHFEKKKMMVITYVFPKLKTAKDAIR